MSAALLLTAVLALYAAAVWTVLCRTAGAGDLFFYLGLGAIVLLAALL